MTHAGEKRAIEDDNMGKISRHKMEVEEFVTAQ